MTQDTQSLLGYRLKLAQHAFHRRMEDALRRLDLTPAQYAVLTALAEKPDQTNADLAVWAFIAPQSMQGVLAKLEASRLVERRQDITHGRRQLARLTDAGRDRFKAAQKVVLRIEAALEAAVPPLSSKEAVALMARLHDAMAVEENTSPI